MKKNDGFLRFFIPFVLIAFLLFGAYKYYEFVTIRDFVAFQNKAEVDELRYSEKSDKLTEKATPLINTYFGVGETTVAKKVKKTDAEILSELTDVNNQIVDLTSIELDQEKDYGKLLNVNKGVYEQYQNKLRFFLSDKAKQLSNFIGIQLGYYLDEMQLNESNLVSSSFVKNYFEVLQERMVIANLTKIFTGKPKKYYVDNYSMFASLEKYTRDDFKFSNEEAVKSKRPYGYEWLDKNRKYFASYYELVKEYAYGDQESYNYKYQKFNTLSSEFNIDMTKVYGEADLLNMERLKNISKSVQNKFILAKKLQSNKFNEFPVFGKTGVLSADLVMCQSYEYRYSIYNKIMGKYPSSTSLDDLISDYDGVNLSIKTADQSFDRKLLKLTVSDKNAVFECHDPISGEDFRFVMMI